MSGGGFLREVLHGSHGSGAVAAHGLTSSAGGGAAGVHRQSARNSQAVKVILSEAYVRWCSDPDTFGLVETLAREMLAAARAAAPAAPTAPPSSRPTSVGQLLTASAPASGTSDASSQRYSDPLQDNQQPLGDSQRSTSPSPPPSPPMRQRQRKDADDRRTPSPIQHSTRYLGVDELDAHHRVGSSPGAASPVSPTSMHATPHPTGNKADPHVPLPAGNHLSHSLDTAVYLDSAAQLSTSHVSTGRGSSPTSDQHATHKYSASTASSQYALQPPAHSVPQASLHDVPAFFYKSEPEGVARDTKLEELDALANHFSAPGAKSTGMLKQNSASAIRGGRGSGSSAINAAAVEIDANKTVRKVGFGKICKDVFGIPLWLKDCLYRRIAIANGLAENQPLSYHSLKKFYDTSFGRLTANRRLFELLRQNPRANVLTIDDLKVSAKYLVESHPSLEFLKQPEFQDSYCRTVAIRIVYELEQRHQRCVTWQVFDRSDLPNVMRELDDIADINQVLRYFSYEHFYVLYCRFWELDTDRDQLIGLQELQSYSQSSITTSVLQRVVQGAGRRLSSQVPFKLDFEDFIYFCLSEEDKNHPAAIYYWFRVLDVDCDGVLSGYELGKFFEENKARFQEAVGDELKYDDMLCQMLDMVGANKIKEHKTGLTLADLRSCDAPSNFFNMIFNCSKFLNFEHRDPFAEHQQKLAPEKTDWDRFARIEYDRMANEVS